MYQFCDATDVDTTVRFVCHMLAVCSEIYHVITAEFNILTKPNEAPSNGGLNFDDYDLDEDED
jgi:hypothetical protein